MLVFSLIMVFGLVESKRSKSKILKENDPRHCRCGEAREGEKITPRDIQDWDLTTTTTTTTEATQHRNAVGMLSGDLDDTTDNKRIAVGALNTVDKMLSYYKIDDQRDLKKKYAPYVPQMRPWLAIVEVNMTNSTLNTECTGAVLSPWWVITSRSCVCADSFGCNLATVEENGADIYIFPGFKYIKRSNSGSNERFKVAEIHPHSQNFHYSDIALLKLERKLDYGTGIMPICLPEPQEEVGDIDANKEVYISGYNFHFHRKVDRDDRCRTVGGPSMNQKCKFPFLTKISENETIEQTVCSLSMPPSHTECDMLQRAMNWTERVPREMNKIQIRKDISKEKNKNKNKNKSDRYKGVMSNYLMLDCYAESFFQNGWCGTCLESAKPGKPGYCGNVGKEKKKKKEDKKEEEMTKEEKDKMFKEKPRPSAWGGWGFCSQLCSQTNYKGSYWSNEPHLKEILRRTPSHEECREFLKGIREINVKDDKDMSRLCLYQEQELAEKAKFEMLSETEFQTDPFIGTKRYGPSEIQPSVGDAGAPVFAFLKNKTEKNHLSNAYLIGVVSLSQILGEKNLEKTTETKNQWTTQMVSRVQPVIKWIRKKIRKNHECIH